MQIYVRITAAAMAAALTLTGCDFAFTEKQKVIQQVKKNLNDPDSAKFETVFKGTSEKFYCGWVNAKNRMGGYTGPTQFIHEAVTDDYGQVTFVRDQPTNSEFRLLINSSDFSKEYQELIYKCRAAHAWNTSCGEPKIELTHMCETMRGGTTTEFITELMKLR